MPLFPVKGKVTFEGEPAAGAMVVFHAKAPVKVGEEVIRPAAQVQPDGSFEVTSLTKGDGAPAGDYSVTVLWNRLIKQGSDSVPGPNVIPDEFTKPETTPLKTTINASATDLPPFALAKSKKK